MPRPPCDCRECRGKPMDTGCYEADPCGPITAPYRPPACPPKPVCCPMPDPCPEKDCRKPYPPPGPPCRPAPDPCMEPKDCPPHSPHRPPKPKPCPPPKTRSCTPPRYPPRMEPCPQPLCSSAPCASSKPCKARTESVLLQKILSCERRAIPRLCTELNLQELPCRARPPFRLMMVQQSGAQPWWTPLEGNGPDTRLHIRVYIPVCCQVQDCEGCLYHATSVIEAEVTLRTPCPLSECWRHSMLISPCVRLLCGECCSEDCIFQAALEVTLDLYLVRPEPCVMRKPEPPCPELPLYPPPIHPIQPYWQ